MVSVLFTLCVCTCMCAQVMQVTMLYTGRGEKECCTVALVINEPSHMYQVMKLYSDKCCNTVAIDSPHFLVTQCIQWANRGSYTTGFIENLVRQHC